MRRVLCLTAALLALAAAGPARADGLFSKPLNTADFGWNSNVNGTSQQSTDDFTLTQDATLEGVA
jgi:hypothetical protein